MSEQDLSDCMALIRKVEKERLALDRPRVLALLETLPVTEDEDLRQRRIALEVALEGEGVG